MAHDRDGSQVLDLTGRAVEWQAPAVAAWLDALDRAARENPPHLGAPHRGDPALRETLAAVTGHPVADLVVTAGVRHAVRGLVAGAAAIVVERPTFGGVPELLDQLNLDWRYDSWAGMTADPPRGGLLWVTSPGRNPDGRTLDPVAAAAMGKSAARVGARVVQNTSYRWYAGGVRLVPGSTEVSTFHKVAGPGARLGFAAGPGVSEWLRPELRSSSPTLLWQRCWDNFICGGGLDVLATGCAQDRAARTAFLAGIGVDGGVGAEGAHVLLRTDRTNLDLAGSVRSYGLLLAPGEAFAAPAGTARASFAGVSAAVAADAAERLLRAARFGGWTVGVGAS